MSYKNNNEYNMALPIYLSEKQSLFWMIPMMS